MATANAESIVVNTKLNTADLKKQLEVFFSKAVFEVKASIDASKMKSEFKNTLTEMNKEEIKPQLDTSQIMSGLSTVNEEVGKIGSGIENWSASEFEEGLQTATSVAMDLGEAVNSIAFPELSELPPIPVPEPVLVQLDATESAEKLKSGMSGAMDVIGAGVSVVGSGIANLASFAFADELQLAKTSVLDIGKALGTDLAPAIGGVATGINDFSNTLVDAAAAGGIAELFRVLPDALIGFLATLPDALTQIMEGITQLLIGVGEMLPTVIPMLVDTLMNLLIILFDNAPQLLEAALKIITGLTQGLMDSIPVLIERLPELITGIVNFLMESIPIIIQTGIDLLVTLVQAMPEIVSTIVEAIPQIIDGLVNAVIESIPAIIQAGVDLLVSLIQNLPDIIITLVEAIPQIVLSLVDAIVDNIDKIILAGVQLFMALITNLPTIIIEIVKAVPDIVSSLISAFADKASTMDQIGLDLVKGIFNGISNSVQWLYGQLKGWVGNVMNYIKGLFGINSPSKLMRDTVGVGIAEGVAVGISENTDLVSDAMAEMADVVADSDLTVEPEISAKFLDFEAFKKKLRPSLDFVRSQLANVQDVMTTQFSATAQLAATRANASMNATYNNGHTYNNNYSITAANISPKATADAIKNQQTLTRMLYA